MTHQVLIIGAGPSGSIAGALLKNKGYQVTILERLQFPRFSIGESLLPQCMAFIEEANMLPAVLNAGFQFKNGAAFAYKERYTEFLFTEKFTAGICTTFQVQRGSFDKLLADEAVRMGVDIKWQVEVLAADFSGEKPTLSTRNQHGEIIDYEADFVLDASGFGRVLPRLLDLESPSGFPVRQALFGHIEDRITSEQFDRNKIRITVHPQHKDVWFWLIPFSNGRSSIGVVAEPAFYQAYSDNHNEALQQIIAEDSSLSTLLGNAVFDDKINTIVGYSANVKSLYGKGYALLGNAGEFLDPVFSSGVTIAMKSASLAAAVLDKQFKNETVDWQQDYAEVLQRGVNTFRAYVDAWYDGRFQDIIFYDKPQQANIKAMISSILAGYAWDQTNPYVKNAHSRLNTLVELCRDSD
jgi:flavin-dependent dehydrogenase